MARLSRNIYLNCTNTNTTSYVEVFVDVFFGLSQVPTHRQRPVLCILFRALDKVFRQLEPTDTANLKKVLSPKKI